MNLRKTSCLNFSGSFIVTGKLSSQNKKILESFKRYSYDGIRNESIISKKCYDVYVSKSPTSENIILFSKFNYFDDDSETMLSKKQKAEIKEKTKLLLILDPNRSIKNESCELFRKRLENFEKSKKYSNGFNSKLEYWKNKIKAYFY